MLVRSQTIGPFLECLSNRVYFDPTTIAKALTSRVEKKTEPLIRLSQGLLSVMWTENVLYSASDDFLRACVRYADIKIADFAAEIPMIRVSQYDGLPHLLMKRRCIQAVNGLCGI
jgi:hypothetical protein